MNSLALSRMSMSPLGELVGANQLSRLCDMSRPTPPGHLDIVEVQISARTAWLGDAKGELLVRRDSDGAGIDTGNGGASPGGAAAGQPV